MGERRVRAKIGDVVAIPLREGRGFVFGRVLRDASLQVFDIVRPEARPVPDLSAAKTLLSVGVFDTSIRDGSWPVVGRLPFAQPDEEWSTPKRLKDLLNPANHRIYFRGEIRPATAKEVARLEQAKMYKPQQLTERLEAELATGPN